MPDISRDQAGTPLLWVRFEGPGLEGRAVPIQELGETLVAVQRVLHKAYLFNQGRLTNTSVPRAKERREIGLQIGRRDQGSDAYGLAPLIEDPFVQKILAPLVVQVIGIIAAYSAGTIKEVFKKVRSMKVDQPKEEVLLGVIYPQVRSITRRIGRDSGIDRVRLYAEDDSSVSVMLDMETKKTVNSVGREKFYGERQMLVGRVRSLWYDDFVAVIERSDGYDVKVRVPKDDFERLRHDASLKETVEIVGRPVFRMGVESLLFREFEADNVHLSGGDLKRNRAPNPGGRADG